MSAPVSEEDVLAHLVLYGARPVVTNVYATDQINERDAWSAAVWTPPDAPLDPVAVVALARLRGAAERDPLRALEVAIADSERRFEVEEWERAVLRVAEEVYFGQMDGDDLGAALEELLAARKEVERHAE